MSGLRSAQNWLNCKLVSSAGESVIFRRADQSIPCDAIPGATKYEVTNDYGVCTGAFISDFLIPVSSLGLTPERGDWIEFSGKVYEVAEYGAEGCWRWSDPYQTIRRVHTKETGAVDHE